MPASTERDVMTEVRNAPATNAADRLLDAVDRCSAPVCVGLDPVIDRLPAALREAVPPPAAIELFCKAVIDAVAGIVPCVKPQSACFERYGAAGLVALHNVIIHAHQAGLEVILDAKRGDISVSASHYAAAAFNPVTTDANSTNTDHRAGADWLTAHSYLGVDSIEPLLTPGRGIFALVRTSNPGGDAIQQRMLADGRTIAQAVADMVAAIGASHIGTRGYSAVGAVVGATKPDDARSLRERMPQQVFLVPGYGAQGGGAADVVPCFNADGRGAIVTASRSVIYAYGDAGATRWAEKVRDAVRHFADEITAVVFG